MSLYEKILNREEKIALVGLGYVGMPIAVAFTKSNFAYWDYIVLTASNNWGSRFWDSTREIWVLCESKNKYVKYYLGIGAVVNLVFNTLLIHIYGIEGAAVATLIT